MVNIIKSGNTNCYIVRCGDHKILIDAGTKADKQFVQRLQKQTPIEDIDLVLLTHGHYDHVGYVSQLQNEYGRKIAIHKGDFEKVSCGKMDFPHGRGLLSSLIRTTTLRAMSAAQYNPFIPDIVIENEIINGLPKLQILSLPGHTKGSIGIVCGNSLFVGDLVMNMPFPTKSWFAEDFDVLGQSISLIRGLNVQRIYPGHGNSFSSYWLKYL